MEKNVNKNQVIEEQNDKQEIQQQNENDLLVAKRNSIKQQTKSYIEKQQILDKFHKLNKKFNPYDNFNGPINNRKCTDCVFNYIFYLILISILSYFGYMMLIQNIEKINYLDFRAQKCGKNNLNDKQLLYYLQPQIDINVKMCVTDCPTQAGQPICLYDIDGQTKTQFCYTQMNTEQIGRICVPTEPLTRKKFLNQFQTYDKLFLSFFLDLYISIDFLCYSFLLSALISLLIFIALRKEKLIKIIIWIFVLNIELQLLIFALFCRIIYNKYIQQNCLFQIDKYDCGGRISNIFYWLQYIMILLSILYIIIIAFLFNKVNLAISFIKCSQQVTKKLKESNYLPLIGSILIIILLLLTFITIIFCFSTGQTKIIDAENIDGKRVKIYKLDYQYVKYLPIYILLTLFIIFVIRNIVEFMTGFMIAKWFFYRHKQTIYLPLKYVFQQTIKYHLGSIVLYTIIKKLFGILKNIIDILYNLLDNKKQNKFIIIIQSLLFPLFFIYFKFLRYFNKDWYIQNIMWSENLWKSSRRSYFLLLNRHKHRKEGPDSVYKFVLLQIKISITLTSSMFILFLLLISPKTSLGFLTSEVQNILIPLLIGLISNFYITSIFFDSFYFVNRSIIQCYFMDTEMFVGVQRFTEGFISKMMEYYEDNKQQNKKIEAIAMQGVGEFYNEHQEYHLSLSENSDTEYSSQSMYNDKKFYKKKKDVNSEKDFIEQIEQQIQDKESIQQNQLQSESFSDEQDQIFIKPNEDSYHSDIKSLIERKKQLELTLSRKDKNKFKKSSKQLQAEEGSLFQVQGLKSLNQYDDSKSNKKSKQNYLKDLKDI